MHGVSVSHCRSGCMPRGTRSLLKLMQQRRGNVQRALVKKVREALPPSSKSASSHSRSSRAAPSGTCAMSGATCHKHMSNFCILCFGHARRPHGKQQRML